MPCLALQVKSRNLRVQLYDAVNAVIEHCGKVGMDAALLDTLVDAELQRFYDRFQDEPRAAVYVQHIMGYYAARKRAYFAALLCCVDQYQELYR